MAGETEPPLEAKPEIRQSGTPLDGSHGGFNEPQPEVPAHTKLVIKGGERRIVPITPSEDWVDPPLPGGYVVAIPDTVYTQKDLFSWANYLSPPRGWPQAFTWFQPMKDYIKKLGGRKVRVTEAPHPLELERLKRLLQADPQEGHARFNAVAARRALGWEVLGGWILLEERQGGGRKDPVEKALYHAEKHCECHVALPTGASSCSSCRCSAAC